jgi:hypothetical protein
MALLSPCYFAFLPMLSNDSHCQFGPKRKKYNPPHARTRAILNQETKFLKIYTKIFRTTACCLLIVNSYWIFRTGN